MILPFIEFIDAGLLRLIFNLLVDYLISAGYLLPTQRQQWVDGYAHILGIFGAVVFMAIWQWHSHKKDATKQQLDVTVTENKPAIPQTPAGATPSAVSFIK
jgi:membrane associated rhomboid family serine protease